MLRKTFTVKDVFYINLILIILLIRDLLFRQQNRRVPMCRNVFSSVVVKLNACLLTGYRRYRVYLLASNRILRTSL